MRRAPALPRPRRAARRRRRHRRRAGARTAAGARQALPGVLAVDVDQLVGRFAQLRDRGGAAVDPAAALALASIVRRSSSGVAGAVEAGFVEPAAERRRRRRTRR